MNGSRFEADGRDQNQLAALLKDRVPVRKTTFHLLL